MAKILTKEVVRKDKGQYIRVRHIYRIFGLPIYFRDEKTSYARDLYFSKKQEMTLKYLSGNSPMILALGAYITQTPNILEKIQKLVANVSFNEAKNILLIIKRLKDIYENENHTIKLYDDNEIAMLKNMYENFYGNILQISPNAFVYGGYFLPINHFEAGVFYYKHGLNVLESSTLQKIKSKDFIDVGGFIGYSAIIFEREFCDKKIYTFEATKTNYDLMLETLKLNDSKRIVPVNKGLGAEFGRIDIQVAGSGSTMSATTKGYLENTEFIVESAEIITLDSYVEEHNIDVGFIKVDIEGFEQEFLKGAFETISRCKPAMLISIYHNASDFFDIKPMIESWDLGYTFKFHKPLDGGISGETALYCEIIER